MYKKYLQKLEINKRITKMIIRILGGEKKIMEIQFLPNLRSIELIRLVLMSLAKIYRTFCHFSTLIS